MSTATLTAPSSTASVSPAAAPAPTRTDPTALMGAIRREPMVTTVLFDANKPPKAPRTFGQGLTDEPAAVAPIAPQRTLATVPADAYRMRFNSSCYRRRPATNDWLCETIPGHAHSAATMDLYYGVGMATIVSREQFRPSEEEEAERIKLIESGAISASYWDVSYRPLRREVGI